MSFTIHKILPYQRTFNFINSVRGTGKTYTAHQYFIKQALQRGKPYIYITRKAKQLQHKGLLAALSKVINEQYLDIEFYEQSRVVYAKCGDEDIVVCKGLSLADAFDSKNIGFVGFENLMFDEYIIDLFSKTKYVNGYNEPDIFLNLYHTIDRGSHKLKCYFFGNNATFYNPYHIHPAFNIPPSEQGRVWYNKGILYYWSNDSPYYEDNTEFTHNLMNNTEYGRYALGGEYAIGIDTNIIKKRHPKSIVTFNIKIGGNKFSFWNYRGEYCVTMYNNNNAITYTDDIKDTSLRFTHFGKAPHVKKWITRLLLNNLVSFETTRVYSLFFSCTRFLLI